jgi:hypothetical protein
MKSACLGLIPILLWGSIVGAARQGFGVGDVADKYRELLRWRAEQQGNVVQDRLVREYCTLPKGDSVVASECTTLLGDARVRRCLSQDLGCYLSPSEQEQGPRPVKCNVYMPTREVTCRFDDGPQNDAAKGVHGRKPKVLIVGQNAPDSAQWVSRTVVLNADDAAECQGYRVTANQLGIVHSETTREHCPRPPIAKAIPLCLPQPHQPPCLPPLERDDADDSQ